MSRSLIAKKENDVYESGAQIINANPSSPVANQLWINTATKKMCFYDTMVKELFNGYAENAAPSKVVEMAAVNVDWSLGTVFRKVNTTGTINTTFSNVEEGKTIVLIFVSDSLVSSMITLPAGTKIQTGDSYALASGKGIAIEVSRIDGVTYARTIFKADLAKFPYGALGDLTITNGQTVNIAAGSIRDYNNLTIDAGGTLNIQGGGSGPITIIGVAGNLVVNGTIKANDGTFGAATYNVTTPLGETVSYSITQKAAGAGHTGASYTTPAGPGGSLGYGGGGSGGGGPGQSNGYGGPGGANNGPGAPSGYSLSGGTGGVSLGNGYTSTQDGRPANYGKHGGGSGGGGGRPISAGGAGGGYKGKHGLGLYLYVLGSCAGTGQVQLNGTNGFNGGSTNTAYGYAGGGGGAGAGGSGGKLMVRARAPFTIPYTVSGGTGGSGGGGPLPGGSGQAGLDGSFDFAPNTDDVRD